MKNGFLLYHVTLDADKKWWLRMVTRQRLGLSTFVNVWKDDVELELTLRAGCEEIYHLHVE